MENSFAAANFQEVWLFTGKQQASELERHANFDFSPTQTHLGRPW
jgi:hypothetical protein